MRSKKDTSLDSQLKQAVKDFEAFPEWKKKFYREME